MDWRDIAAIVFACTAVNHLGLIAAVGRVVRHPLPIVSCPKCLTFWSILAYGAAAVPSGSLQGLAAAVARLLAISLLCSYLAIWLELVMYAVDTIYNRIYEAIKHYSQEKDEEG